MDRVGNRLATEDVDHGLLFDVILLYFKHKRDEGGMVKLITGCGGNIEAAGYDVYVDISKT